LFYDDDGNFTSVFDSAPGVEYTDNAENRLIAATFQTPVNGDKKLEFTYDYMAGGCTKSVWLEFRDLGCAI